MSSPSTAVVPKSTQVSPAASEATVSARSATGVEPVTSAQPMHALSKRGPSFSAYWRASTEVGAMTAAWVPLSATAASATAATAVLPVPTSPRSRRFMGRLAAMSERISCAARSCSPVSEKGMAASRALMCGPSTTCAFGRVPSSEMAWRASRAACRHKSSSKARRRRACSAATSELGKCASRRARASVMRRCEATREAGMKSQESP